MSNPSLILPQSPAYGEDYVYAAQVYDGEVPVYDVLPLTFTRASGGSRINKDGLVQNMPYNLLSYSEEFNNTSGWTPDANGGSVTITANYGVSPNGTTTADRIQITKGPSYSQIFQTSSVISGAVYTISVYLKSLSGTPTITTLYDGTEKGTQTLTTAWARYEFSFTATSSTVYPMIALYTGNSASMDILAWGFQLNIGSTAQPYLATTDRLNMPRITYPVGGGCGALLLEKQSTNIVTYSEDLTNAAWIKQRATISTNATTSPDGTQNADKLIINNGVLGGYVYQLKSTSSGTVYTGSFYVKAGGVNYTKFYTNISGSYNEAVINLSTGAITNSDFAITPTTQNIGNGWYRVNYTTTSGGGQVVIYIDGGSTSTGGGYTGNGIDGVFIWGGQVEASYYATSYISTTSASSTRIADACYKTGISNLIGQTEGTLFAEMSAQDSPANNWFQILDGSANNWIFIGLDGSRFRGYVRLGSSTVFDNLTFSFTNAVPAKIALAYKSGDIALYINGTQIAVSSNTFTPSASLSQMVFGDLINPPQDCAQYNQAKIYKTRLTNAELATLTTL